MGENHLLNLIEAARKARGVGRSRLAPRQPQQPRAPLKIAHLEHGSGG